MSIQKPTAEELKQWETALQDEGLGMDRATNTRRLVYGEKSLDMAPSWDDVRLYVREKRKETARICHGCALIFAARADAKCCSATCRKRLERLSQINSTIHERHTQNV